MDLISLVTGDSPRDVGKKGGKACTAWKKGDRMAARPTVPTMLADRFRFYTIGKCSTAIVHINESDFSSHATYACFAECQHSRFIPKF